jgi:flagellar biogenesis protein FliO
MNIIQYIGAITLVLGLLGACIVGLQRSGVASMHFKLPGKAQPRAMEVVERLALTPNHSLHLVRCEGETLLIGISPSGCNLLTNSGGGLFRESTGVAR